jgi:signal transduction histidine kinase
VTRRVRIALVITALLVVIAVIVPLGVLATRTDRESFRADALADAGAMAAGLTAQGPDPVAGYAWDQWARRGDQIVLIDPSGQVQPAAGDVTLSESDRRVARAALAGEADTRWDHDRLVVAVPVEGWGGAVLLVRPSERLDAQLGGRWLLLGVVGLLAVAGAAALAWWAGQRVAGPVRQLRESVDAFGAGDLGARVQVDHAPAEVRALADEFNRTAARLDQLVHSHRSLLADVAHQLRTPLAALRLHLELAAADLDGADTEELDAALAEVSRLSRLVDGLLAAARAESGSGRRDVVTVADVVTSRLALWRPLADERGVRLQARPAQQEHARATPGVLGADCQVWAGAGHLEQVLYNLLANALDAGAAHIQVGVDQRDGQVSLSVIDDGPGLPQERRDQVLHRYAAGRPGGTGLGLSIVDRLVTADGGRLSLSDSPGGGLTATVVLPAARRNGRGLLQEVGSSPP